MGDHKTASAPPMRPSFTNEDMRRVARVLLLSFLATLVLGIIVRLLFAFDRSVVSVSSWPEIRTLRQPRSSDLQDGQFYQPFSTNAAAAPRALAPTYEVRRVETVKWRRLKGTYGAYIGAGIPPRFQNEVPATRAAGPNYTGIEPHKNNRDSISSRVKTAAPPSSDGNRYVQL